MTSTSESSRHSPVETAAVVAHGRIDVRDAVERVRAVAGASGVTILDEPDKAQLTVAVGGDGTILRTLAGEYRTIEQPTLEAQLDGKAFVAVNDVVATSSTLGRMIELGWAIAGEDLGVVSCDGMICSTPSGSTAYNLSNGGPVLVRGIDAMAITFIAPHSLEARPLVVPRGAELTVRNASADVGAAVLVDGHRSGDLAPERSLSIRLGEERSLLATLPETTFFGRYRETFTSER
jgi:NAD+ kinase